MKILLAGQAYFREDNGQAAFTVRLARGLVKSGHRVMVLSPSDNDNPGLNEQQGVKVWRIRTISLPHNANISLFAGSAVREAVGIFKPDIIHLQDHYFICRPLWRAARKKKIPVVGSNHFLPENLTANLPLPQMLKQPLNGLLWKHMLSLYNTLASVSTPTKTAASILHAQNIRPQVAPISCGIDTHRFHPLGNDKCRRLRKRFNLKGDGPVFLYVGRLDHEKGLDTVVTALAGSNRPNCSLILAGKGSFSKGLHKLCRRLHLEDQVRFPGFIAEEDLPWLLGCVDCFVMAGFAELQSIATLEAMACGLPVIAANAGALPELVTHEKNGLLFEPQDVNSLTDAINTFLDAPERWRSWGDESRRRAKCHAFEKTVQRYLDWYKAAAEEQLIPETLTTWNALPSSGKIELQK